MGGTGKGNEAEPPENHAMKIFKTTTENLRLMKKCEQLLS